MGFGQTAGAKLLQRMNLLVYHPGRNDARPTVAVAKRLTS